MLNWKEIAISRDHTIQEAMVRLNESSLRVVLVVDPSNYLQGVVTDGDIRRGLLEGVKLSDPVNLIMNTHPITLEPDKTRGQIKKVMLQKKLLAVPIVDDHNCVLGLETIDSVNEIDPPKCDVVLMAGGFGKRLYPLTKETPKPMLKIGNKPILEMIIENFVSQAFSRFFISTHYKGELIQNYFKDGKEFGCSINYVNELEPLGTAGALNLLKGKIENNFIVMNGDLLTKINFQNLLDFHRQSNSLCTVCVRENAYQVPYGVVEIDGHLIKSIKEKPVFNYQMSAGIYCFSPQIFEYISAGDHLDMPALLKKLLQASQEVRAFPLHEYWIDIGRIDDFERASVEF
jgi:dTDP-glucose pyrophosphorylase